MPFGWRSRKPGYQNRGRRAAAATKIQRAYRAAKVSKSRSIAVSSGQGRNGFKRRVGGYRRGMSRFQRAVRRVIFSTTEKKYRTASIQGPAETNLSYNTTPWYHNSLYRIDLWNVTGAAGAAGLRLFPVQGVTDGDRVGDEIYVTGIKVKLILNLPSDRRTTNVKVWYVPHDSKQGDPNIFASFFNSIIGNSQIDQVNTDRWPGLKYLGLFRNNDPDNTTTNAHGQIYMDLWIPIKRKVTFNADIVQVISSGMKEVGTLLFAPYDKIGTLGTDIVINNMQGSATLHFKDP